MQRAALGLGPRSVCSSCQQAGGMQCAGLLWWLCELYEDFDCGRVVCEQCVCGVLNIVKFRYDELRGHGGRSDRV